MINSEKDLGGLLESCYYFCHLDVKIDWGKTSVVNDVYQKTVVKNRGRETSLIIKGNFDNAGRIEEIFEIAAGRGMKCKSASSYIYERGQSYINHVYENEKRVVVINGNQQTKLANELLTWSSSDYKKYENYVRNWRRVIRACSNNNYYLEDSIIVICSAIEGISSRHLNKKEGSSLAAHELKKIINDDLLIKVYKDARNHICHGKVGGLLSSRDLLVETARQISELFFKIWCRIFHLNYTFIQLETRFNKYCLVDQLV